MRFASLFYRPRITPGRPTKFEFEKFTNSYKWEAVSTSQVTFLGREAFKVKSRCLPLTFAPSIQRDSCVLTYVAMQDSRKRMYFFVVAPTKNAFRKFMPTWRKMQKSIHTVEE